MSLLAHHGPRGAPPPTLTHPAPNMTLRQICHMLRLMRQVRRREAAAAAAATRWVFPAKAQNLERVAN